ncbi:MAG TPA: 4-hydroxy-tetrahydrodipicolinate reductase, partial [Candidatus Melainabacteria bacterium]|nr:4-hydroxy-tetrahydrodipicolinate reductase [Candidatus Melainabacteria bacterium]
MGGKIKVAIAGINGKMGRASLAALTGLDDIEVVGAFGRAGADYVGKDLSSLGGGSADTGVKVAEDLSSCLSGVSPDILLEFTRAESCMAHARQALANGIRPLIGTSGLSQADFDELASLSAAAGVGAMVIPNFSVGAVLMMEFARMAGKHFHNVEIVEMHGVKKLDAPSGTATYTAAKLAEVQEKYNPSELPPDTEERELLKGARGGRTEAGVRIHSSRSSVS